MKLLQGLTVVNTFKPKSGMPLQPSAQADTRSGFVLCSEEHDTKECLRIPISIPSATHTAEIQPAEETDCLAEARG